MTNSMVRVPLHFHDLRLLGVYSDLLSNNWRIILDPLELSNFQDRWVIVGGYVLAHIEYSIKQMARIIELSTARELTVDNKG